MATSRPTRPALIRGAFWNYRGYLAPWKTLIAAMILVGQRPRQIAELLYEMGVRTDAHEWEMAQRTQPCPPATVRAVEYGRMTALIGTLDKKRWSDPRYAALRGTAESIVRVKAWRRPNEDGVERPFWLVRPAYTDIEGAPV